MGNCLANLKLLEVIFEIGDGELNRGGFDTTSLSENKFTKIN